MCGDSGLHQFPDFSADYDRLRAERQAKALKDFEELCAKGVVFAAKPLGPLSINDFAEF